MNYEPLSKKILLERGYCCKNGCKNCPYKTKDDNSKRKKHTALIDCDLLAKVYINLIDQKEPTLNFQNQDQENIENNLNLEPKSVPK